MQPPTLRPTPTLTGESAKAFLKEMNRKKTPQEIKEKQKFLDECKDVYDKATKKEKNPIREISLNGLDEFIKHAKRQHPKEACAFLFSNGPYHAEEQWHIKIVDNVSDNPLERWEPDKKQMQKAKTEAKKNGWTKIGNIHSHPFFTTKITEIKTGQTYNEGIYPEKIKAIANPSDTDLSYAQKHNDIIRGILVNDKKETYALLYHNKYGKEVAYYTTNQFKEMK